MRSYIRPLSQHHHHRIRPPCYLRPHFPSGYRLVCQSAFSQAAYYPSLLFNSLKAVFSSLSSRFNSRRVCQNQRRLRPAYYEKCLSGKNAQPIASIAPLVSQSEWANAKRRVWKVKSTLQAYARLDASPATDRITAKSFRMKISFTPTFSGGYVKEVHQFCLYQRAGRSPSLWIIPFFRKPSLPLFSSCG